MKKLALLVCAGGMLLVSACSTAQQSPTTSSSTSVSGDTPIAVVASTDVYGNIAETIGGDAVAVTSIINDPDKDPHSYEADAQTQLALSKAQIVIENGGGYDDFVDTMLSAAGKQPKLINVSNLSGYNQKPSEGEFNEHVWYDFPTVAKLADTLVAEFSTANPDGRQAFTDNAAKFKNTLNDLMSDEAAIKKTHAGAGVAITEPVPLYMLNSSGLTNKTPDEFSEAVEEDTDVAPAVLNQTLALFNDKQVKLLAYNEQTSGPQTEAVLAAAKKNAIAVVPVTETLPEGKDYLGWMSDNVHAVSAALGSP